MDIECNSEEHFRLLLEHYQAKVVKDKEGCTPLIQAGINNQTEIVKYFIENENECWYTISQRIDELELIESCHLAHHYLLWAMQLRYKDPTAPIRNINLPTPVEAYEYCAECQTIEELDLEVSDIIDSDEHVR